MRPVLRVGQRSRYSDWLRAERSGDRMQVGTRFSARPYRSWDLPSLLYNGYRVFAGGRGGKGVRLTPSPSSAEVLERVELHLYSP